MLLALSAVADSFPVDTVSVFRFRSDHWPSEWWKVMTRQHVLTLPLNGTAAEESGL